MAGKKQSKKKTKKGQQPGRSRHERNDAVDAECRAQQEDEWTAISAIFQDECQLIADSPRLEYSLVLGPLGASAPQPKSRSQGDKEEDGAAIELRVRYTAGYPKKPPRLQLLPRSGVQPLELEQLQELLNDQAAVAAREARVAIFSLVETAQEFLTQSVSSKRDTEGQGNADRDGARSEVPAGDQSEGDDGETEQERWDPGGWGDHVGVSLFGDAEGLYAESLEGASWGAQGSISKPTPSNDVSASLSKKPGGRGIEEEKVGGAGGTKEEEHDAGAPEQGGVRRKNREHRDNRDIRKSRSSRENREKEKKKKKEKKRKEGDVVRDLGSREGILYWPEPAGNELCEVEVGRLKDCRGGGRNNSRKDKDNKGGWRLSAAAQLAGDETMGLVETQTANTSAQKGGVKQELSHDNADSEAGSYESDEDGSKGAEGSQEDSEDKPGTGPPKKSWMSFFHQVGGDGDDDEDEDEGEDEDGDLDSAEAASTADGTTLSSLSFRGLDEDVVGVDEDGEDTDVTGPMALSNRDQYPTGPIALSKRDKVERMVQRDLLLGHMLQMLTSAAGPLSREALPALTQRLEELQLLPKWLVDMLLRNPDAVNKAFRKAVPGDESLPGAQSHHKAGEPRDLVQSKVHEASSSDGKQSPRAHSLARFWASPENGTGGRNGSGGNEAASAAAAAASRYLADFSEEAVLGKGGFGQVILCMNKLDGRKYAVKRIPLKDQSAVLNSKILREVATLSRLQHHNVVRYYQAWFETGVGRFMGMLDATSEGMETTNQSWLTGGGHEDELSSVGLSRDWPEDEDMEGEGTFLQLHPGRKTVEGMKEGRGEKRAEGVKEARGEKRGDGVLEASGEKRDATFLYIQMEYCPRTLRQVLDSRNPSADVDKELTWRVFRQIVDGLVHIHSQGVVHRDLTPSNIFFDARGDVKIGDFGLAKFTNLDLTRSTVHEDSLAAEEGGREEGGGKGRQPGEGKGSPGAGDLQEGGVGAQEGGFASRTSVTGQVGTYFYTAPENEQGWAQTDEKVDIYSLGVVLLELWIPFETAMERALTLTALKRTGHIPDKLKQEAPQVAELTAQLTAALPGHRPSARDLLQSPLVPPRMEDEALNAILRTLESGEDTSVFDRVISSIFAEPRKHLPGAHGKVPGGGESGGRAGAGPGEAALVTGLEAREAILARVRRVFELHRAVATETPILLAEEGDDTSGASPQEATPSRRRLQMPRALDSSGALVCYRYETRRAFAKWLASSAQQQLPSSSPSSLPSSSPCLRRYEVSRVFRRAAGRAPPLQFWQADLDLVVGPTQCPALAEAECLKVAAEVMALFPEWGADTLELRINHRALLGAVWEWSGTSRTESGAVAQLLAVLSGSRPGSSERKTVWPFIRRQLLQGYGISEETVDRLQLVERRYSGVASEVLPRLRGALPSTRPVREALEELSQLLTFLRLWGLEPQASLDPLMAPSEDYFTALFWQVRRYPVHVLSPRGPLSAPDLPAPLGSGAPGQPGPPHGASDDYCTALFWQVHASRVAEPESGWGPVAAGSAWGAGGRGGLGSGRNGGATLSPSTLQSACVGIGGRYDGLLQSMRAVVAGEEEQRGKAKRPAGKGGPGGVHGGAVGLSLALHTLMSEALRASSRGPTSAPASARRDGELKREGSAHGAHTTDYSQRSSSGAVDVLVCSRGGGGRLEERMEVAALLWGAGIRAEFLGVKHPSLTEQYEFAQEHGIKWLVIVTDVGLATETVKVRNIETRLEEDVAVTELPRFLADQGRGFSSSSHQGSGALNFRRHAGKASAGGARGTPPAQTHAQGEEQGLKWVIKVSEGDLERDKVRVRTMDTGWEEDVPISELPRFMHEGGGRSAGMHEGGGRNAGQGPRRHVGRTGTMRMPG